MQKMGQGWWDLSEKQELKVHAFVSEFEPCCTQKAGILSGE